MKQILIVDDENIIRKGLQHSIDWESLNCSVIGTAKNGEEGLKLINELKPDIVLADVKMPHLSGLEMAELALKDHPNLKFIVISGYSDFDNVKQAIKLSAVDFIQKPISDDELISAVNKAIHEININETYHHHVENELVLEIMRGRKPISMLPYKNIGRKQYQIVLFQLNTTWISNHHFKIFTSTVKRVLKERLLEVIICHDDIYAVISEFNDTLNEDIEYLSNELKLKLSTGISVGVSTVSTLVEVEKLYLESKTALDYKLVTGFGSINYFNPTPEIEDSQALKYMDFKEKYRSLVKNGSVRDLKVFIKDLFEKMNNDKLSSVSVETVVSDLLFILLNQVRFEDDNISVPPFEFEKNESNDMLIQRFDEYVTSVRKLSISSNQSADIDKQIEMYIYSNYLDNITITLLSDKYYLSESTISRKIKTLFGKSLSDVIHNLRMEDASMLLKTTTLTVFEIATKTGYTDYRYFSTVFKKQNGLTPSEYRNLR